MQCRLGVMLALMLFIGCLVTAALTDNEDNFDFMDPQNVKNNVDYADIKSDLRTKIENIFHPTNQQANLLNISIESAFQSIIQAPSRCTEKTSSTQNPATDNPNNVSCGEEHECVKKWICRSEKVNELGNHEITFRSASNTCGYQEVCCHISDKIESTNNNDLQVDEIADCGTRHITGVGQTLKSAQDQEAEFGEFPWMVAIMAKSASVVHLIGGGSILTPNVVLTAAHTVENQTADQLKVRAGEWDMKAELESYPHVDRNVSFILVHNEYSKTRKPNNIALLVLSISFSTNPHISPICLPSVKQNFDHSRCIVTGWGKRTHDSFRYQRILKKITVPVLPHTDCLEKLHGNPIFDKSYICAGGEKDMDSCHGDGGAPLVCPIRGRPNRYVQAGIVAWGIGCGQENVPSAYTNVAYLMPWVTEQLDKLESKKKYYTL